jgi:signal peptidase I
VRRCRARISRNDEARNATAASGGASRKPEGSVDALFGAASSEGQITTEQSTEELVEQVRQRWSPVEGQAEGDASPVRSETVRFGERWRRWWHRLLYDEQFADVRVFTTSFAAAVLLRAFVIEPRYIPSLSMFPTFEIGDQLLVDKVTQRLGRHVERGDVVVFYPPPALIEASRMTAQALNAAGEKDAHQYGANDAMIKRVVAVAGDTVAVRDGRLYVNGEVQVETYITEQPDYNWGPVQVPDGCLVVLGDNRSNSLDSHIWGFLPERNVIGRAVLRYWPITRVGLIEH